MPARNADNPRAICPSVRASRLLSAPNALAITAEVPILSPIARLINVNVTGKVKLIAASCCVPNTTRKASSKVADDTAVVDLERYVPAFFTWIANKLSGGASTAYLSAFNVGIETWRLLVLLAAHLLLARATTPAWVFAGAALWGLILGLLTLAVPILSVTGLIKDFGEGETQVHRLFDGAARILGGALHFDGGHQTGVLAADAHGAATGLGDVRKLAQSFQGTAENLKTLTDRINKGEGIDSYKRYIYIHGTPEEGLIGQPASHGCIRMLNKEVIEVFNKVPIGTLVVVLNDGK